MIEIRGLTVALAGRVVLDGCDLSVTDGEVMAVSGASGSGKSTLLRTIIGRHRPRSGEVVIDGATVSAGELKRIRSRLYYLPQDLQPLKDETVREFLTVPFRLAVNRGLRFSAAAAGKHLDALGLREGVMGEKLRDLSGGERKRLGLVLALLLERPLWLLDEPTASVDEHNGGILMDAVFGQTGATIIAVTHDPRFIQRASRCVEIVDGRIIAKAEDHGHRRG